MSIKTEQLSHSLKKLDALVDELTASKVKAPDDAFREHIEVICIATLDCLCVIYHILLEAK